jgi:5-methylcytosine-specific restriction endonuclease McrA
MKKTLLLDSNYAPVRFITDRRAFKLLCLGKAEAIDIWDDEICLVDKTVNQPSVLRLISYVIRQSHFDNGNGFSRKALIKRDNSCCQYCGTKLSPQQVTIDHVIPRSLGGKTNYNNCVVSCLFCNSWKGNNTPERAGMRLIRKPTLPSFNVRYHLHDDEDHWHHAWDDFLNGN